MKDENMKSQNKWSCEEPLHMLPGHFNTVLPALFLQDYNLKRCSDLLSHTHTHMMTPLRECRGTSEQSDSESSAGEDPRAGVKEPDAPLEACCRGDGCYLIRWSRTSWAVLDVSKLPR